MQNILKKRQSQKINSGERLCIKLREGIYNQHTCVCVYMCKQIVRPTQALLDC